MEEGSYETTVDAIRLDHDEALVHDAFLSLSNDGR